MEKSVINKESPLPLYFQIKENMRYKILSGELQEGDYMPSEFKLMQQYNVSRPTIRQAIDLLVQENYLEKKRGIGTLITKPKADFWDLTELRSFDEEAQRKGFVSETQLLGFDIVSLNDELKEIFGDEEQQFYRLERLRFINKIPLELVTTYVPKHLANNLESYDFSKNSLFDVLSKVYGVKINQAEKTFKAINASKADSKILKIPSNSAIQLVRTVTFDSNYVPIEFSISRDRGVISKFKVILSRKYNS